MNNLLNCPADALLKVISFLSGNDTLRLLCVSHGCVIWCRITRTKSFFHHLTADYPEGQLLFEAFACCPQCSSNLSYKKNMYLAFSNRWNLAIHLAAPSPRPAQPSSLLQDNFSEGNEDVNSLVFIVHLWDRPDSCGFWTGNSLNSTRKTA